MKTKDICRPKTAYDFTDFVDSDFIRNYWAKRPTRVPLSNCQSLCDEDSLLIALKRYSDMPAELKQTNPLAEYVTGVNCLATQKPIESFAIQISDSSLDSYLHRVNEINASNEWSIAYFGLHGASEAVWDSAKVFIKKLSSELGYRPGGRVDVDCFIGRYSSTPSGVHVDEAHNFGFTFRSGKTMFTWDPAHSHLKWLKSPAYDPAKKYAIPLANDPGFVCYFPHDALHIGETKERPSVNVNISFWKESEPSQATQKFLLSSITSQKVAENRFLKDGVLELSSFKAKDLKELQESILNGSLETYLATNDLLEQTTFGLRVPRPIFNTRALNSNSVLRLKESATINWYQSPNLKDLLIGVNGHCICSPKDDDVLGFLGNVASGFEFRVADLVPDPHSDLGALIQQFHDWGAFHEIF